MKQPDVPASQPMANLLPEGIPVQRDPGGQAGSTGDAGWIAMVAVVALLLLAAAAWQLVRRRGRPVRPTGARGALRVSNTRLTPRHSLHVVAWQGRQLLVGCSDDAIRLLAEAPLDEPEASP